MKEEDLRPYYGKKVKLAEGGGVRMQPIEEAVILKDDSEWCFILSNNFSYSGGWNYKAEGTEYEYCWHTLIEEIKSIELLKEEKELNMIKLKTVEDLLGIVGKRISFLHSTGAQIESGIIEVDERGVIVLHSDHPECKGCNSIQPKYGYKYTFTHGWDLECMLKNYIVNQEVTLLEDYYYYEGESFKTNNFFPNKPIAVYASNISEEDARATGNVTWLLGMNLLGKYITWDELRSSIEGLIGEFVDDCSTSWNYVVPVLKPIKSKEQQEKEEKKALLQKQLDEIKKQLEDL